MKLVNYALQNQIEYLSEEKSKQHFKEYLQSILEDTSTPFFKRCDYVGLSLTELKSKIDTLAKDISELQAYKKKLTSALDIAKTLTAEIFQQNGIDRMDGNIISSLTIQKSSTKEKNIIN
jgi:vacuolar-type H+-ATPase catalytic subunit A/Vma1